MNIVKYFSSIVSPTLNISKKILFIIAVYFVAIALFFHFANTNKPQDNRDFLLYNREKIYKFINDPSFNKSKEGKLSIALFKSLNCSFIGEACTDNPNDADKNFSSSLFGKMGKLMTSPFVNPPASGVYWAYDGLQNIGLVPKTYAAEGIGFGSIKAFSKIWLALRNTSYLILVLIVISLGFMIMFRMKLNPQTVISIENSLPKIVLAIIFITFSFAISGFLIDMMYVTIGITAAVLGQISNPGQSPVDLQQSYLQSDQWQILSNLLGRNVWDILWKLPNDLLGLIGPLNTVIRYIGTAISVYYLLPFFTTNVTPIIMGTLSVPIRLTAGLFGNGVDFDLDSFIKGKGGAVLTVLFFGISIIIGAHFLIPLLIGVIILLTVLLLFFRILFLLFNAYLKVLFLVIISPIYLLLEALPGQSVIANWIRNLISELITFPLVVAIFILSKIIISSASAGNTIQFPFMVDINPEAFGFIIGMLILFKTPDFVAIIQKFFNPKPLPFDAGVGEFFGGATTGVGAGMGEFSKYVGFASYFSWSRKFAEKLGVKFPGYPSNP